MNLGDLDIAHTVIDDADQRAARAASGRARACCCGARGSPSSATRPAEAREALDRALESSPTLSARDALLAQAVHVAIARRYEDAAAPRGRVATTRATACCAPRSTCIILLPLAELVTLGGARRRHRLACSRTSRGPSRSSQQLGSPPLWSAHLRWAGIQQGILLNRPDDLKPHARALVARVAAQPRSRPTMAQAGRVWTAVLAGSVDADAVEAAAQGLGLGRPRLGRRAAGRPRRRAASTTARSPRGCSPARGSCIPTKARARRSRRRR